MTKPDKKEEEKSLPKDKNKTHKNEAAEKITAVPETAYSWYLHLYNSFHWNGGTVETLQMTEDELGIKINLPFRDSRLIEFLAAMPESWGRGLEMRPTKYPIKGPTIFGNGILSFRFVGLKKLSIVSGIINVTMAILRSWSSDVESTYTPVKAPTIPRRAMGNVSLIRM